MIECKDCPQRFKCLTQNDTIKFHLAISREHKKDTIMCLTQLDSTEEIEQEAIKLADWIHKNTSSIFYRVVLKRLDENQRLKKK